MALDDVANVTAYWLDCKTLEIERCPFCRRKHWHAASRSPYRDIRPANCLQRHLPKRLLGKALFYRLWYPRSPCEPAGQLIPFPKAHARGDPAVMAEHAPHVQAARRR